MQRSAQEGELIPKGGDSFRHSFRKQGFQADCRRRSQTEEVIGQVAVKADPLPGDGKSDEKGRNDQEEYDGSRRHGRRENGETSPEKALLEPTEERIGEKGEQRRPGQRSQERKGDDVTEDRRQDKDRSKRKQSGSASCIDMKFPFVAQSPDLLPILFALCRGVRYNRFIVIITFLSSNKRRKPAGKLR